MKCLLLLSVLLCVTLSVSAAAVDCGRDWTEYQGRCYRFTNMPTAWLYARSYCNNMRALLASPHDSHEYAFLQRLTALTDQRTTAWLGGHIFENTWLWEDGSEFDYTNWSSKSVFIDRHPCVYLTPGAGWANRACTETRPFLCMKKT